MSGQRSVFIKKLIFIAIPLVLILMGFALSYWLFSSVSGASWLWGKLELASEGQIQTDQIEGDLAKGFVIHGLKYRSEGMHIRIDRAEVQAKPVFWPISIEVSKLFLQDVSVTRMQTEARVDPDEGETDTQALIESIKLPFPLNFKRIRLTKLSLRDANNPPLILLDSLTSRINIHESLSIEQLQISSKSYHAEVGGHLSLSPPFEIDATLDGEFFVTGIDGAQVTKLPVMVEGDGDLDKLQFRISSDPSGLFVTADIDTPLTDPKWKVTGELKRLPKPLALGVQMIDINTLSFDSQGDFLDWTLDLASGLNITGQPATSLVMSAVGSGPVVNIKHSALTGTGINIELNGRVDTTAQSVAGLHLLIKQLDMSHWLQDWPSGEFLTGEMKINHSANGLNIAEGLISVAGTEFEANISADINLAGDRVDASVDWQQLSWPLRAAIPQLLSRRGQLDINGSIDEWLTAGMLDVKLGEYPEGRFQISGNGDRYSSHIELLEGDVLGGRVRGEVRADWRAALRWSVELLARGVDPEPLLAGWPGQLDTKFRIATEGQEGHFDIEIDELKGVLRDTRIDARGGLELAGSDVSFHQLELHTDEARLHLNGAASESAGVAFTFSGDLPSALLQGARGKLEVEGRFSSHTGQPSLEMQMQGLDVAWRDIVVKTMAITAVESQSNPLIPAVDFNASGLQWRDETINEITMTLRPDDVLSKLTVNLASELIDLTTSVSLSPEDTTDLLGGPWLGELEDLELAISQKYRFKLTEPSQFTWSTGSFSLQPACLRETEGAALCAGGTYGADGDLSLSADISALPLDYLRDLFELDVGFEQKLDGKLEWSQSDEQLPAGGAELRISGGNIVDLVDNEPLLESQEGSFRFKLRNGNLETGTLDIKFPDVGFVDVDFEVLDFTADGQQQLKGRVVSQLNDIKIVGQLAMPGVDDANGQFNSDIRLGGSLTDPQFDGGFSLSNGLFYYAPLGLRLEDVNLQGNLERRDRGSLKGKFRAGQGIGSLDGQIFFENLEQVKLDMNFSGDQLLLVNTSTFKMLTETRLAIGLSPGRLDIDGKINVPSAHLTPSNLIINTVNNSDDLIIINSNEQEKAANEKKAMKRQVFGKLEVSFGEDVKVKIPGVETSIKGNVMYDWSGDPVPKAEGNYYLTGTVDIYGPRLEISNGSIAFPGVRADNPLLNIRAQREIFGNTQIRSAGVQLIGTLKRPVVEAYTIPVTNEDRAWSLLVTGSDFDQGQGVGGFDVGTYIAPRLYVSYGISLFDDDNVISARYDLKKGFGIKVTSGQRESGLDVSYTVDK